VSNDNIKLALERALAQVPGALPETQTQRENVAFEPQANLEYWRVTFFFIKPQNPTFGDGLYVQTGYMQVLLCWPEGVGTGAPIALAEAIRTRFKRGLSFVANSVTTTIDGTPEISNGRVESDRYCVPIRVRFFANIPGG
jgi:uncharacterized protein DUF4128